MDTRRAGGDLPASGAESPAARRNGRGRRRRRWRRRRRSAGRAAAVGGEVRDEGARVAVARPELIRAGRAGEAVGGGVDRDVDAAVEDAAARRRAIATDQACRRDRAREDAPHAVAVGVVRAVVGRLTRAGSAVVLLQARRAGRVVDHAEVHVAAAVPADGGVPLPGEDVRPVGGLRGGREGERRPRDGQRRQKPQGARVGSNQVVEERNPPDKPCESPIRGIGAFGRRGERRARPARPASRAARCGGGRAPRRRPRGAARPASRSARRRRCAGGWSPGSPGARRRRPGRPSRGTPR